MLTTLVGNYPKIPLSKSHTNLRQALNDFEKGLVTEEELEDIYTKTILRTLNDQERAGVDLLTDGQIRWMELTYPLATSLIAVHPGGLRRFFENNTYYRRPQITGLISRHKEIVTDEYRFAAENSSKPVKAVLCGPITFCDLSDNYYYKSFDALAEAVAEILIEEIESLVGAGCRHIQLDEPSLPLYPQKMELASSLYRRIFGSTAAECGIFIYFNSIAPIFSELFDLPVSFIGLDLVSHPDDMKLLAGYNTEKTLVAGIFDGRNIMLENEKTIRAHVDQLSHSIPIDKLILSPSCGLEYLPYKYAVAKMNRMCEVAKKLTPARAR